jgi:hypothetical protein
MATRVDCSTASSVPYCTTCGWRGQTTTSRTRAFQSAAQHRAIAHPEDQRSAQNLRRRMSRAEA